MLSRAMHVLFLLPVMKRHQQLYHQSCTILQLTRYICIWTIIIMLMHVSSQDVQEKARQEVIAILGDEPKDVMPTQELLKNVTYINMVIKEVLLSIIHDMKMSSLLINHSFHMISH